MMIERAIYDVLAAGRDEINENPLFLETFLKDPDLGPGLSDEEVAQIRKFWTSVKAIDPDNSEQTGVSILHQFPRDGTKFPCWSIVLINEQESTQFLGDEAGYIGDDGEDVFSSIWDKSYAVFTYVTNPLVCLYYHELAKFFLIRGRQFLKSSAGGYNLSTRFSGGDMGPDPRYTPANMFVRRLQIDLSREERVLGAPQIRATKLRGLFGTPEGPDDVQDVKTDGIGVGTYVPGDEE